MAATSEDRPSRATRRPSLNIALRASILASGPCAYCGDPEPIVVDHVIPWAQGGANDRANLAPACQTCNVEKLDRTPDEWRQARIAAGGFWPPVPLEQKAAALVDHFLARESEKVARVPHDERDAVREHIIALARSIVGPFAHCHRCGDRYGKGSPGASLTHCAACA